jgi:hypothetical protein
MFHKEEYMKFVSAGYMAADPTNRQEVFSDGDHISGNSLEPGGWSLENDNGAYKPARFGDLNRYLVTNSKYELSFE